MEHRYFAIAPDKARWVVDQRRLGGDPDLTNLVECRGQGVDYQECAVDDLRSRLLELKNDYSSELKKSDPEGGRFESEACVLVHRLLPVTNSAVADPGFWIWLAVVKLPDIVEWRHGGEGRFAELANYGIGNRTENLMFRMWLRAEIVYDPSADDPYYLSRFGDQDLWRSHIIRQGYSSVRDVAKCLISFQYGDGKPRLSSDGIRELAKRLRRLRANMMMEFLTPARIMGVLEDQAKDLS
jgi:hypothetical protein